MTRRHPTLRQLAKAATDSGISWLQPAKAYKTREERDAAERQQKVKMRKQDLNEFDLHNARAKVLKDEAAVRESRKILRPALTKCRNSLSAEFPDEREKSWNYVNKLQADAELLIAALERARNRILRND